MNNYNSNLITKDLANILSTKSVGIIGLGGSGSILCQSLAHIGIRKFVLVDHDKLEEGNLKKVVGTIPKDVGQLKTHLMKQLINNISGYTTDSCIISERFTRDSSKEINNKLANVDFIFLCVDNYSDSLYINNFCVLNKIPFIECGVGMKIDTAGLVTDLVGQIKFIKLKDPCLGCYQTISGLDYLDKQMPYIQIHSIISNLAVMEFLKYITNFGETNYLIFYDALKQTVSTAKSSDTITRCNYCKKMNYT